MGKINSIMSKVLKCIAIAALVGHPQVNAVYLKSEMNMKNDSSVFEVNLMQEGTMYKRCTDGEVAVVNYTSRLRSDGTVVESNAKTGIPYTFVLGQAEVVECLEKGIQRIDVGAKAQIECPASMAYGTVRKPGVPENSDL